MKIALVCSEVVRESGHGRYMLELARRLAPEHEVHVYSHHFQPIPGVTHHRVPALEGITLFRVFSFFLASTLRLGLSRYDVIHTIGGCTLRRDVVTAQFCQRTWGDQLRRSAAAAGPEGRGWLERLGRRARRWYHEIYWRACDLLEAPAFRQRPGKRVIAVSNGVRDELAHFYGVDSAGVAVVYNGVEPADFAPEALAPLREAKRAELGFAPDEQVLLFVGEFYRKGLSAAIAALRHMATPRVRLLVVGRGEIEAFRAQAAEWGVDHQVVFAGFQPQVVPYFAAADAFVFPTRYEPFGMVITEAMAAGLPVVTTAAAGASEVITPGADGMVVDDPDDAEALAARLDAVLADPARRAEMGRAARQAAGRVDWDYTARETLKVYEELLAARAVSAARRDPC